MTQHQMNNAFGGIVVGNPARGNDFFDRKQEISELLELIQSGSHVTINAPRRIGKTSLILEAGSRLGDEYAFLFVDAQACQTEVDLLVKLTLVARDHRHIGQKALDAFQNVLTAIKGTVAEISVDVLSVKLREGLSGNWQMKAGEILRRLANLGRPVVICIDELPVMVSALLLGEDRQITPQRIERTRVFLSWLRETTISYQGTVRYIVSGSIGLEPLLARAGISDTLNTFTPLAIGPWNRDVALEFIADRIHRCGLELANGAADQLISSLGELIPHHVAMFTHFVCVDARRRGENICSVMNINNVYKHNMLSVQGHVDLATYEDRLKRVIEPKALRPALELLTEAAIVGILTPLAAKTIVEANNLKDQDGIETMRFLLNLFEHDGYLKKNRKGYVFVSHLLRDWWRKRFGFGYVKACDR